MPKEIRAMLDNPKSPKQKTRAQVEAMQAKAVRFLNDVADKPDAADDIEAMSVEEYAQHKHITIGNPGSRKKKPQANPAGLEKLKRLKVGDAITAENGSTKYIVKKTGRSTFRLGEPYGAWIMSGTASQVLNRIKTGRRQKNPDVPLREAQNLYREFHGKAPSKVLQMQMSEAQRGTYTALGELWELDFKAPNKEKIRLSFEGNHVKLASSPDGNQLYLIGGDQRMEESLLRQFGAEGEKDFVALGEATKITYVTRKAFDGFKEAGYVHKFGEEGGYRPFGFYNRLQRVMVLAGGSYHIEAPGIIN